MTTDHDAPVTYGGGIAAVVTSRNSGTVRLVIDGRDPVTLTPDQASELAGNLESAAAWAEVEDRA